jgi:hypothetical protein
MAAGATGTQAWFVSGSATDPFHRSRFLTDRRCKTLGDFLLRLNAERHNAMQSIKGIYSQRDLAQAGSVAGEFLNRR